MIRVFNINHAKAKFKPSTTGGEALYRFYFVKKKVGLLYEALHI